MSPHRLLKALCICYLNLFLNEVARSVSDANNLRKQAIFRKTDKVRLTNHVLKTLRVDSSFTCAQHCLGFEQEKEECQSFNYQNKVTSNAICELNNSTTSKDYENTIDDNDFSYFEDTGKICHAKVDSNCANPKALGMESGRIPDDAITASSIFSDAYKPSYGRLRKTLGSCSWTCEKDALAESCWHKVDLGVLTKVTGISTQGGCIHSEWITTYEIMYSCDNNVYTYYKEQGQPKLFTGNTDQATAVTNSFHPSITARYVRLMPKSWNIYASLRVEYHGCRLEN